MKKFILFLLISFLILNIDLFCIEPNFGYYQEYFWSLNSSFAFNLIKDYNSELQIGGPAEVKSFRRGYMVIVGTGLMVTNSLSNTFYGIDLNFSGTTSNIESAILNDIRGINSINDTVPIKTSISSSSLINSFIISPYISFLLFKNSHISCTIQPQFLYNFNSFAMNSYSFEDSNFVNFIGKPKILKNSNNEIIKDFRKELDGIRKFDMNLIASIEYRYFDIKPKRDCYDCPIPPSSKIDEITIGLNLLLGISPIDNKTLIIRTGLALRANVHVFNKYMKN